MHGSAYAVRGWNTTEGHMKITVPTQLAKHGGRYGMQVAIVKAFTKNFHAQFSLPHFMPRMMHSAYKLTFWARAETEVVHKAMHVEYRCAVATVAAVAASATAGSSYAGALTAPPSLSDDDDAPYTEAEALAVTPSMAAVQIVGWVTSASPIVEPTRATTMRVPASNGSGDTTFTGSASPTSTVRLAFLLAASLASTTPHTAFEHPVGAALSFGAPETPSRVAMRSTLASRTMRRLHYMAAH